MQTLDRTEIRTRLSARLDALDGPMSQDPHRAMHDPADFEPGFMDTLTEAAVLVPILDRPSGLTVLLTLRTSAMPTHAGQISFPGGRLHSTDRDHASAALREAEEEIGLPPARVTVLGKSSQIIIGTGYRVTPIIGLVDAEGFELAPNPREVADMFEAPLDHFLNPDNYTEHQKEFQGKLRRFFAAPYQDHYIWGATAAMLWALQKRIND